MNVVFQEGCLNISIAWQYFLYLSLILFNFLHMLLFKLHCLPFLDEWTAVLKSLPQLISFNNFIGFCQGSCASRGLKQASRRSCSTSFPWWSSLLNLIITFFLIVDATFVFLVNFFIFFVWLRISMPFIMFFIWRKVDSLCFMCIWPCLSNQLRTKTIGCS